MGMELQLGRRANGEDDRLVVIILKYLVSKMAAAQERERNIKVYGTERPNVIPEKHNVSKSNPRGKRYKK